MDSIFIQGPLAGYSCAAMRLLVQSFGGVAYTTTEMLSAYHLVSSQSMPRRLIYRDPREQCVCYQLSGTDPQVLADATAHVRTLGADMVDLNCGCPQPKIRKKGAGSAHLQQPDRLFTLLSAMRSVATDIPLTVKIRIDGDSEDAYNRAVVQAACAAGVDAIIVHGRHHADRYTVPVNTEQMAAVVEEATCPVIANGDVVDAKSAKAMMRQTGAAGIMVSRLTLGKPWGIAKLVAESHGEDFSEPGLLQRVQLWRTHVLALAELEPEMQAILQARGLFRHYFPDQCQWYKQVDRLCKQSDVDVLVVEMSSACE